jgi:oligopeptide transport system substrate-binding protein
MTRLLSLAMGAALALAIGCGRGGVVEEHTAQGILDIGNGAEPQELDPYVVTGFTEHKIISSLLEGLVELDPKTLEPEPATAESWTVSDDGKVYTFKIRQTAKWSNGDPLTAHDFVYGWKRHLSPGLGSEYSYMLHCIEGARDYNEGKITDFAQVGVKALDDHTLEVRLNNPTPYFLSMQVHQSYFPVHRATIERFGRIDERGTKWTQPGNYVGNGPFKLTVWKPGEVITVVPNEHYWDAAKVRLKAINFYPIESSQTEERTFRAGGLHITGTVPIEKIRVYQQDHPELLRMDPFFETYFYRLNVTKPPLDDVRVRRALAMAVDRKTLVERVTKGGETPAHFLTPPDTKGYTCETTIPYDVAEAQRLLAEAGYPGGQGFPPIELLYNTLESHKQIAEAIQNMWKRDLGIDVVLTNQEWKVYLNSLSSLNYQVARSGWIGDYLDPNNFLECFLTDGGNNRTGWSNAEYDGLLAQAALSNDPAERNRLFQQAEAILMQEAPVIPIYFGKRKYLIRPEVKGYEPSYLGQVSYKNIYLEANDS